MMKDLGYYLTLFKIKGHKTWRADLKNFKDGFDNYLQSMGKGAPTVTEMKKFRIDRITGAVEESK